MIIFLLAIILALLLLWSIYLPFYREKVQVLVPDEDKCFSPDCRSIAIKNGSNKAILFIHGFPTTPCMYAWATKYASGFGYDIYAPLIPTFGASYDEMIKTNFSSWFYYIDSYYRKLREEYQVVYVIGVSMGGAMTLKLAEVHSGTSLQMDGIAVLSAPVTYNSLLHDGIITNPMGYFARILKLFIPKIGARICTSIPEHDDGDENWHGYKGVFPRQGVSLMYNFKIIRKNLFRIKVPMLAIHDKGDMTVPFANLTIIRKETNTDAEFIESNIDKNLKHTHHALLSYRSTQKPMMDRILDFFKGIKQ